MSEIILDATPEENLTMHRIYIAAFERLERRHDETVKRLENDVAELKHWVTMYHLAQKEKEDAKQIEKASQHDGCRCAQPEVRQEDRDPPGSRGRFQ